jgi:hypothetical protein
MFVCALLYSYRQIRKQEKAMTTTQLEKAIARCESEIADMGNTFEQRQDWKRHFVMLISKGRYCTPQELA